MQILRLPPQDDIATQSLMGRTEVRMPHFYPSPLSPARDCVGITFSFTESFDMLTAHALVLEFGIVGISYRSLGRSSRAMNEIRHSLPGRENPFFCIVQQAKYFVGLRLVQSACHFIKQLIHLEPFRN